MLTTAPRSGGVDHRPRGELGEQEGGGDVEAQRGLEEALAGGHRSARASCRRRCSPARRAGRTVRAVASTSRSRSSVFITSVGTASARRPSAAISAATSSRSAAVRAAHTTSAPASANPIAMPRPMPLPAPVTIATCPSRRNRSRITPAHPAGRCRGAARDERQVEVGLDPGLGRAHVRDRVHAVHGRRDDAAVARQSRRDRVGVQAVEHRGDRRIAVDLDLEALALGTEASTPGRGAPRP